MLRMIDRHAVQQMLTAGVRIGEVARHFEVSRRTIERIRKEPAVEGADAVARWKRGVGRPPVPATVRERMRALIAEDPEAPPLGRRMPALDLVTANGPLRVFTLLHDARPVLLNLGEPDGIDITPWADRVQLIDAKYVGTWERPVPGAVLAPTAGLIRPDGYVACVGDRTHLGLPDALTTWFGPPTAA
jgi:hypothetical protein